MRSLFRDFLYLFGRRDLYRFAVLIVLMLFGTILEMASLGAAPLFVQLVLSPDDSRAAAWLGKALAGLGVSDFSRHLPLWGGLALGGLFLFRTVYLISNFWLQEHLLRNRQVALGSRLFRAYMSAPYPLLLRRNSSTVINFVSSEAERLVEQFLAPALNFLRNAIIVLAVVVLLVIYDPVVSLGSFCALGLAGGVFILAVNRRLKSLGETALHNREVAVKAITEGIGAFREARLNGSVGFFAGNLHRALEKQARPQRIYYILQKSLWPSMELLTVTVLLAAMSAMLLWGRDMQTIAPALALVTVALARLKGCLTELMLYYSAMRYQSSLVRTIAAELRDLEQQAAVADPTSPAIDLQKAITVRHLDFRYDAAAEPTLRDISLEIPHGASVALVGPTGSGKSTLVNLIVGLLEPTAGDILIDGRDLSSCVAAWQRRIGYVPQDIFLLDDTILANVALGVAERDIDEAAFWRALATAQLDDFVAALPEGGRTILGERGARLSGGQRQRIGIARALYRNPAVLVLDEATSALDTTTESALTAAVEQLRGAHTVILIAHRLSTVRRCDQIFFLDGGRLVAQGTYDELLASTPAFRAMASSSPPVH
ncbi:MAG: Multidrug resistance ABC transporter ATP-binding and permease protein [Lentisphaerae bacterium ADurb.Bin082]|nr:MAG: Multidrug resistance ABC transporter ATP-binding and permease protein [Lentisphaerae bacterium ADurb.Bin082]HQL86564.1 ABC transporter ATP-binding protein [Lentisphaeria bacterium]